MTPKDQELLKALQLMRDQQKKTKQTEAVQNSDDKIPSQTGSFIITEEGGAQTGGFLTKNDPIDTSMNSGDGAQTGSFIAPIEVSFHMKSIFDGSINIDLSCARPEFLKQSSYLENLKSRLEHIDTNIKINVLKKEEL
ncbi:hypothetical protein [Ascidiimonas sp. W6]|uniref:hypothetical protein n=1 Tax=Ascidiimonas meishanensis TaxID=3128903 RepID=UPI0030ED67F0